MIRRSALKSLVAPSNSSIATSVTNAASLTNLFSRAGKHVAETLNQRRQFACECCRPSKHPVNCCLGQLQRCQRFVVLYEFASHQHHHARLDFINLRSNFPEMLKPSPSLSPTEHKTPRR